jgi:hypothetical protein
MINDPDLKPVDFKAGSIQLLLVQLTESINHAIDIDKPTVHNMALEYLTSFLKSLFVYQHTSWNKQINV